MDFFALPLESFAANVLVSYLSCPLLVLLSQSLQWLHCSLSPLAAALILIVIWIETNQASPSISSNKSYRWRNGKQMKYESFRWIHTHIQHIQHSHAHTHTLTHLPIHASSDMMVVVVMVTVEVVVAVLIVHGILCSVFCIFWDVLGCGLGSFHFSSWKSTDEIFNQDPNTLPWPVSVQIISNKCSERQHRNPRRQLNCVANLQYHNYHDDNNDDDKDDHQRNIN